ncbi:hypothetical protein BC828DRAFT_405859 [Blastocladiella britannica]|nr:hypothetical protein BC828DRAFT_405859 [Blastocladiella britannica]
MAFRRAVALTLLGLAVLATQIRGSSHSSSESVVRVLYHSDAKMPGLPRFQAYADAWSSTSGTAVDLILANSTLEMTVTEFVNVLSIMKLQKRAYYDIVFVDVIWPSLLTDMLLPLDDLMSASTLGLYDPGLLDAGYVNGKLYAVPFKASYTVLYYRQDLLRRYNFMNPPATWDEMETQLKIILPAERAAGRPIDGYLGQLKAYEGLTCDVMEWLASVDAGPVVEQIPGSPATLSALDSTKAAATISIMSRLRRWIQQGLMPASVLSAQESTGKAQYESGKAVFMRNWFSTSMIDVPTPANAVGAIAPLPGATADLAGHATNGGNFLGVNRHSANVTAAVAALQFLTSRDSQALWFDINNWVPSLSSFAADPNFCQTLRNCEVAGKLQLVARPSAPTGPAYLEVSAIIYNTWHNVLAGEVSPQLAVKQTLSSLSKLLGINILGPVLETSWQEAYGFLVAVICAISICCILATIPISIQASKTTPSLRHALSVFLTAALLAGGLLGAAWPLTFVGRPSCTLQVALPITAWTIILTAVAVRDLQVFMIITSTMSHISKRVIRLAWSFIAVTFALQAMFIGVWAGLSAPEATVRPVNDEWQYSACGMGRMPPLVLLPCSMVVSLFALNIWLAVKAAQYPEIQALQRVPTLRLLYVLVALLLIEITLQQMLADTPSVRVVLHSLASLLHSISLSIISVRSLKPPSRANVDTMSSSGETQSRSASTANKRNTAVTRPGGGAGGAIKTYDPSSAYLGSSAIDMPLVDSNRTETLTVRIAKSAISLDLQLASGCYVWFISDRQLLLIRERAGQPKRRLVLDVHALAALRLATSSSGAGTLRLQIPSGVHLEFAGGAQEMDRIAQWKELLKRNVPSTA